jgi:hypothetical protein
MTATATLPLTPDAIAPLRQRVDGEVLLPGDDDFDIVRRGWNLSFEHRPAVIAVPSSASDVVEAVRFAWESGLHVTVHNTGHGVARPADGGLLLVTDCLDDVLVDPAARRAWVGGGSFWEPVLEQSQLYGLAPLLGSSPFVGAVGYTLGGGMGWLAREYGLAADSVHRFDVVTADGQLRRVSATEDPELFWGLKGAGAGSFGVVTGMEIELYPVATVYAGNLFYPATAAAEVLGRWQQWIHTAPDELTSSVVLMNFPPLDLVPAPLRGRSFAIVRGCYDGPERDGAELMRPWREWQTPEVDAFGPMPFTEVASISADPVEPLPARATAAWLRDLTVEAIRVLVTGAFPADGPPPVLATEIRHAGGAISRVDPASAAVGNRDAQLSLEMIGLAPTPHDVRTLEAHTRGVLSALGPVRTGGQYLNFLEGEEKRNAAVAALGAHGARRATRLKAAVDPDDVFDAGLDLVAR